MSERIESTILIVEDDVLMARSMELNLKRLGYTTPPPVRNAAAALAAVAAAAPDLILMDIQLQDAVDGIEIARQIRASADIPIIYTTAYADERTIARAKVTEPYGYLVKPFGVKELSSVVEIALYKHRMEQQLAHLNRVVRAIRNVNQLITQERDPAQLLAGACRCLVEARGYRSAWIVQLDAAGQVLQGYQAGLGEGFAAFVAALRQGYFPVCWQRIMGMSASEAILEMPSTLCLDCDFSPRVEGDKPLVAFLEYAGVRYGVLVVVLPHTLMLNAEEWTLFKELANDIAFALHTIEGDLQRRRAEEALQQNEAFIRAVLDNLPVGIAVNSVDPVVNFNYMNDKFPQLYRTTREQLVDPDNFWEAVYEDPEFRASIKQRVLDDCASGDLQRMRWTDIPITRKGEATTYVVAQNTPVSGRQLMISTVIDITQHKRAEEQVRRYAERLRSLAGILQYPASNEQDFLDFALAEAVALTDSRFGYIYFYDADTQLFTLNTWSKEVMAACEVQNPQTCYELDKTGVWGEAVRQRRPIILNDFQAEHPLKKGYPPGHAPLLKYLTVPIFSEGRIVAVVGVANKVEDYAETDVLQLTLLMDAVWKVVERKRAEIALMQTNAVLAAAGRMAHFGGWRVNLVTNKVFWSDQVAAIHAMPPGYSPTVEQGINFYAPEWRPLITEIFTACAQEGRPYDAELEIIAADGRRVWVRTVGAAVRDAAGAIVGVEGAFQDISERKAAEDALARERILLRTVIDNLPDAVYMKDRGNYSAIV